MILEAEGNVFTAHIRYDRVPNQPRKTRRCTHLAIHEGRCRQGECPVPKERPATVPLYRGAGYVWVTVPCSRQDEFVRSKGRKVALGRALLALFPHQYLLRKGLWEDFRRKVGELKTSPSPEAA